MMYGNSWMSDGFGQGYGHHAMSSGFGGGFGPASLFTFGLVSILFVIALIWVIAIKGYALWHAAKRNEKWWFIALLIVNTFGLLELVYLLFFAKVWGKDRLNKDKGPDQAMNAHNHDAHHPHNHDHGHNHNHANHNGNGPVNAAANPGTQSSGNSDTNNQ